MSEAVVTALSHYCDPPPADLVTHFSRVDFPFDRALGIHILPLEVALKTTVALRNWSIIGEPFGLVVLDDADTSNHYCYVTRGPTSGSVLFFRHDDAPIVAFGNLSDFMSAVDALKREGGDMDHLAFDPTLTGMDRSDIGAEVDRLVASNDQPEVLCVLISLLPSPDLSRMESLCRHDDFFVREATALRIKESPHSSLEQVAQSLANDRYPQVSDPAEKALVACKRAGLG